MYIEITYFISTPNLLIVLILIFHTMSIEICINDDFLCYAKLRLLLVWKKRILYMSKILEHECWAILEHICVPVLLAIRKYCIML